MADYGIVAEALKRGYSISEIADTLAADAGHDPSLIRERGYGDEDILGKLGYVKPESSDVARGLTTAFKQLPQLGYGLVAGAGAAAESLLGEGGASTAVKEYGVRKYQEAGADIEKDAKESDSLTYSLDQAGQGNYGALVDWMQYAFGYGGAQAAQALASGGIGALLGKTTLKAAVEKLASGMVAKEVAKISATETGAKLAADQVSKLAIANVATKVGQAAGIGAQAFGMEGGEIFGDLASQATKEGRTLSGGELAKAFGATIAAGGLEFVGDKLGFDLMLGKSKLFKPAEAITGVGGRVARAGVGTLAAAPIEGGTEYLQTGIEEYGKGKEANILPFNQSPEAQRQAFDAAGLGAIGGGVMAGGGGLLSAPVAKPKANSIDILKAESPDEAIAAIQEVARTPLGDSTLLNELQPFPGLSQDALTGSQELLAGPDSELAGLIQQESRDAEAPSEPTAMQLAMAKARRIADEKARIEATRSPAQSVTQQEAALGITPDQAIAPAAQREEAPAAAVIPQQPATVQPEQPAPGEVIQPKAQPVTPEAMFQKGDTVLVKGSDKVETVESVGPDGWVYTLAGAAGPASDFTIAKPKEMVASSWGGLVSNTPSPSHAENVERWKNENKTTTAPLLQNPEQRSSTPVAESLQAPAPEAGDVVVAPDQAAAVQERSITAKQRGTVAVTGYPVDSVRAVAKQLGYQVIVDKKGQALFSKGADAAKIEAALNPAETPAIEAKTRAPVKHDTTTLWGAIKAMGGISKEYALDIAGETDPKKMKGYPLGIFRKGGASLDEIARALAQDYGFNINLDSIRDTGGMNQARELIQQAAGGTPIYNMERADRELSKMEQVKDRMELLRLAKEYGVQPKRDLEALHNDVVKAIEFEVTVAGKNYAEARANAIARGIPESEISAIEDGIADTHAGNGAQDHLVLMYRDITNALEDKVNEANEQQGGSGEGPDVEQPVPQAAAPERPAPDRPALELQGQTPDEIRAEERRVADAKAQRLAEEAQDKKDKAAADAADVEARLKARAANPDNFQFGESGKDAAKPEADIFAQAAKPAAEKPKGDTDATLSRFRPREYVGFSKPYSGKSGAKLFGYEWANKKEEYVDNRGEDRVRRVSDWEKAAQNLETGRDIVHQFHIETADGESHVVSAESAAKLLGISESATRASAKRLLEQEIAAQKQRDSAARQADAVDAIKAADSPAGAVGSMTVFDYAPNAPMVKRMAKEGPTWAGEQDRYDRERKAKETYRFITRDGKYIWSSELISPNSELAKRGWKTVEIPAREIWPEAKPAAEMTPAELLRAAADKLEGKAAITDFGEKIGGARKDVWSGFRDKISEISDDEIANQPFSKVWPEPDYQAMLDTGADPWAVGFMHAARDEVPAKPRTSYKVKRWAEQVRLLREMTTKLLSGEYSVEKVKHEIGAASVMSRVTGGSGLQKLASRVELYELVGHAKSLEGVSFAKHHYSLYHGRENVTLWAVEKEAKATAWSNWPSEIATGDTKEEALANFKEKFASLEFSKPASKEVSFDVFVQGGEYFVGKKIGRNIATLAGPFKTVKEARAYRSGNQDSLVGKLEKFKEIPRTRRDTNEPRVGEDMRDGQDVTPEMFGETFGFRGVEFGNWVEQGKRQRDLNDAFDALMDMAAIVGVPAKAMSLNGELGLAFGARGTGGIEAAKAHYERDFVVINLTKKDGAGSIGHEWWHAVDNYFSRMRGKKNDSMTDALDVSLASKGSQYQHTGAVRKEMVDAFGEVVKAIRTTALKARSSKLDSKRTKDYWTTTTEMTARAFESYLISKLQDHNASNDYLANIVDEATWKAAEKLGFELDESYPYPTAGEVPIIRAGFDKFFSAVQTKETDKGVALFDMAADKESAISKAIDRAIAMQQGLSVQPVKRVAARLELTKLRRQLDQGKINGGRFIFEVEQLHRRMEDAAAEKKMEIRGRARGATWINAKLAIAVHEGTISQKTADMASWFIKQNPRLVEDLAISIRQAKEGEQGGRGTYTPYNRMATLFAEKAADTTGIHEILHHLERLMPAEMQDEIRKEYWKQISAERENLTSQMATSTEAQAKLRFLDDVVEFSVSGKISVADRMRAAIKSGDVPGEMYRFVNPSEFWAVSMSERLAQRFGATSIWGRTIQWVREAIQHIKGALGLSSDAPMLRALSGLIESGGGKADQKQGMLGVGDNYNDIGPGDASTSGITDAWQDEPVTAWDNFTRKMQDKLIDTKRIVQAIREAGIKIRDEFDPYLQEVLYHGRAAKRAADFADNELRPLLVEMQMRGITMQELDDYLWVRHAKERNAQIAKINPDMPEGGSGLTDRQAADILAGKKVKIKGREIELQAGRMAGYVSLSKRVDAITKGTTDVLVAYGLEKQETVDAWRGAYKHYAPLMRDMEVDEGIFGFGMGTGQGFSVRGSASRRAMGSERTVMDVLANIAMQRERAITRGEKNRIAKAVLGLALIAKNKDFWTVDTAPKERVVEPEKTSYQVLYHGSIVQEFSNRQAAKQLVDYEGKDGYVINEVKIPEHVVERVHPSFLQQNNVLLARVNGKDHYVIFDEGNNRAQHMVSSLKNLDAEQLSWGVQMMATATRYFASINTQYNPVFGLVNGMRDLSTAMLNLSSTELRGKQADVFRNAWSALSGIYIDLRDHRKGIDPSSQWAQLYEEFQLEGGKTGYRDMFATSQERAESIADELKDAGKGAKWLAVGEKRSHIFGWISDYNTAIENALRLSAYKVAKDQGMSNAQAVALAKNLTVNFNKKGTAATTAGAMYAFFNAAVQGTARIGETMFEHRGSSTDPKNLRLSATGKKILMGGFALGVMQAVMGALAGWDDEEPPQFVRERNFVIPLPSGKYITIPYPLGFHVIPNLGRVSTEFVMGGFKNPGKRLTDLAGLLADAFNPIGNAGLSMQTVAPTILDPVAALTENKDWTGKKIYREDFDKMHPSAGWTRTKDTASGFSKAISYGLNYLTGGGKYGIGLVSPTPDQLDYLVGQATGGVGRETLKVWQAGRSAATGEDLPMYKLPVAGRFVGETTGQASEASRFYHNLERIGEHRSTLKEMREAHDSAAAMEYLRDHRDARMVKAADAAHREIAYLRRQKRDAIEKGLPRERIKLMDERITTKMRSFNDRIGGLEKGE